MDRIIRESVQERVYGYVSTNYNSFMKGIEVRIDTPTLSFTQFVPDTQIANCKKHNTLIEQIIINYELEILKHFIKGKGV